MAVTIGPPALEHVGGVLAHVDEIQGPERAPDEEHGDQEAEVADPVHDERLLAGVRVGLVLEPEPDQQVGTEPDPFPPDEHHREAGPEHKDEHEDHEQVQVREIARVARVFPHVADAEQVDEAAHAGDDEQHHRRELVRLKRQVHLQPPHRQPGPERDHDGGFGLLAHQPDEHPDRYRKGAQQHAGTDQRDEVLGPGPPDRQRAVQQEAEHRQRDGQPHHVNEVHQPRSRLMVWRSTDCL